MRKAKISLIAFSILIAAFNIGVAQTRDMNNPFFSEYKTPFQVPPFNEIKLEHFKPAMQAGIADQLAEIKAITENKEAPVF